MANVYHANLSGTDLHFTTGDKLSNLSSIPSGAGDIPSVNLDGNAVVLTGDQTIVGVKTFSNNIIGSGDIYSVAWVDYSASSTVVGWSSFTTKQIYYKKIGKMVFVTVDLRGTSNATNVSFTLPYTNNIVPVYAWVDTLDNGSGVSTSGKIYLAASSATVVVFKNPLGDAWTASGSKMAIGQFWYEVT